jgi:hypothetical protein
VKFDPRSGLFLPRHARSGIVKARPCMAAPQQAMLMGGGGSAPPPAFDPDYGWDAAKGNETSISESGQLVEWTGQAASTTQISRSVTAIPGVTGGMYCELELVAKSDSAFVAGFGVATAGSTSFFASGFWSRWSRRPNTSTSACGFNDTGGRFIDGFQSASSTYDFSPGDRLAIAYHLGTKNLYFAVNNTWLAGNPPSDGSTNAAMTVTEETVYVAVSSFACGTSGSDSISWRIYPHAAGQLYAPPTGYTPYQP